MRDLTFLYFGLQKTKRERWRAMRRKTRIMTVPETRVVLFLQSVLTAESYLMSLSWYYFMLKLQTQNSFNVFSFVTVCAHLSFRCTCVLYLHILCSALCWCNLFLLMQMLFELSWQLTCVWGIFTAFTNVYDDWTVYNNIIKKYYLFRSFLLLPHLAVFE